MRNLIATWIILCGSALAQPTISAVYVQSSTATTATIVWTTNTAATSQIKYETTNAIPYANGVNYTLVTSHSMTLTLLNASQPYYFAVVSVDGSSHSAQSSTYEFALCGAPQVPVVGTVNQFYYSGTYSITWNAPSGAGGSPTICGQPLTTPVTGTLNLSGGLATQVADALKVTPGPGTWTVLVADIGDLSPITVTLPLAAPTQDISPQLEAAAAATSLVGVIANNNAHTVYPPWLNTGGTTVNVNGSPVSNPNFNSSAPSPDAGHFAATLKVAGSDVIVQLPTSGNTCATPGIFNVSCPAYGAKGDTVNISGCSIASTDGTNTLTCNAGSFPTSAIVGDIVQIFGSGTGSGTPTQDGSIMTWISTSQVTLSTTAGTTVSGATGKYGHNDTAAITSAIIDACAAGIGTVYVPPGFDSMIAPATYGAWLSTYQLTIPCGNVSLLSNAPGATLEFDGAAHQIGGNCIRGRGIGVVPSGNSVNNQFIWLNLNGNTSGNTHNSNEPALPGTGCDGWDLSNQGLLIGGNEKGFLMDHSSVYNFKGELVYGGSYTNSNATIRNTVLHSTNADLLSIQAATLLVDNNELYDCYTNAAEDPQTGAIGSINTYSNNYIHDCSTGLNLLGSSLTPPAMVTRIDHNVFQHIGTGANSHGSNYLAAVQISTQFTGGIQGEGTYSGKGNTFIDNANDIGLGDDGTPYGVYGLDFTDTTFIVNDTDSQNPITAAGPLTNVTFDGFRMYRTPYATTFPFGGYKFAQPFVFANGSWTNVTFENGVIDLSALHFSPIWGQNCVGCWSTAFPNEAPLWRNMAWTGTSLPTTKCCTGNGIIQTITSGAPTIYPGFDQAYINATGGTVVATIQAGNELDGDELTVTMYSGTITLTSDSNMVIGGGPITLNAGGQAKFVYAQATGKWVMVWHS